MNLCFFNVRRLLFLLLYQVLSYHIANAIERETFSAVDTNLVNELNQQAPTFWSSKPDSTIFLAKKALSISTEIGYTKGQMVAYRNLGIGYYEKGNYTDAVQSYRRAIALAEVVNDTSYQATLRSNLAMPYLALGAHNEALENLYDAIAIAEKKDLISTVAHATHNIGMVYHYQHKNEEAIAFYNQSQKLYESIGDTSRSTFILGNIAHLYLQKEDFKNAEKLYLRSLVLAERQENKKATGNALQSLGAFFMKRKEFKKALSYYHQAKDVLEATGEQTEYLRLLDNLAACYTKLNQNDLAELYALRGFKLATQQQQLYYIQTTANQLSSLYEKRGDYKGALDYFKLVKTAADSLYSQQNKEELVRMEEQYKYKKEKETTAVFYDMQLKRQNLWLYGSIALVVILSTIAMLLVSNIRQKRKTNHILEETNIFFEEQNALLETSNHFKEQLISLVAHDIRNPMASLQKVLLLFENKHLSSNEIQQLMSSSHQDVNSLIRLLDDLLMWVRLQLNYTPLQKTSFYIQDVLRPIVDLYQQQADDKNIRLVTEEITHNKVYADREAIATVFRNLIDNGIKFSNPGDRVHILTESIEDGKNVVVYISDTGIGMSAETVNNLFTTPTYVRRHGTRNEQGSGLGLQICMHYLQLNNSELRVESYPGVGTRFWFALESAPKTKH